MKKDKLSNTNAREIVMSCIQALNDEDFAAARQYMSDDMNFVGVLGSRQGADAYFKDMEHMRLKYDVEKVLADKEDVCLFYNLSIENTTIFGCGWYHVKDGKINSLRVVFDPRPLLEHAEK